MMCYYSEDNLKFSNRLQAKKYSIENQKDIFYYYNDDVYSKIDWTIEPEGTIDLHYKMQAQRIRDEYDYVILMYSGGYDSSNILEVFHYNNIKLDKIVVTGPFKQDSHSGVDENHNGEIYKNAFPTLSTLGLDSIVQILDFSDYYSDVKQFSVYQLEEEWVEHIGGKYSPYHFVFRDIHKFIVPEKYLDKKVAIIWGTDKPRICYERGRKGFYFTDIQINSYSRFNPPRSSNIENVNFYWDVNYPLILIKQLHMIKNGFQKNLVSTIYNLKHPLVYKSPKSPYHVISIRDNFLLNHKDSDIYKFYQVGIEKIKKSYYINDLSPIKSKFYPIE